MQYVNLGRAEPQVSRICLGMMTSGTPQWRDWVLNRPGITAPIIGASKPGHLEDAVAAPGIQLSPDEMDHLEDPYQPHPVLGHS